MKFVGYMCALALVVGITGFSVRAQPEARGSPEASLPSSISRDPAEPPEDFGESLAPDAAQGIEAVEESSVEPPQERVRVPDSALQSSRRRGRNRYPGPIPTPEEWQPPEGPVRIGLGHPRYAVQVVVHVFGTMPQFVDHRGHIPRRIVLEGNGRLFRGTHRERHLRKAAKGVIRETQNVIGANSLDYKVAVLRDHPLFEGIEYFNAYGAWALLDLDQNTRSIGLTSKQSWIDLNRDKRRNPGPEPYHSYAVVVAGKLGKGKVAAFGDDAIFQDDFLKDNNLKLSDNLAKWLAP